MAESVVTYTDPLTKKQRFTILQSQLESERSSFIPHWRELNDFLLPRRGRFSTADHNRGDRRSKNIIDSTGTYALRTLASGMMSSITSPARPWFRLTVPDQELAELASVKRWLHTVRQRMIAMFLKSNLYNALPMLYKDMGAFGTAAMAVLDDDEQVLRFYPFAIGSYWLANDERLRVRTFMREFPMTVRQIVRRFGIKTSPSGEQTINWAPISQQVKERWLNGGLEERIDVIHVIQSNADMKPGWQPGKFKRYASCYYEKAGLEDIFLAEEGFDDFPILTARWETSGEDVYATDCPGMTALGDVKQLQMTEKRGSQGLEKMVNPPLVGPTMLMNSKVSTLPGDITWNDGTPHDKLRPIYEVKIGLDQIEAKQEQKRYLIRRAFYEDLFLMIASTPALNEKSRDVTATEIEARREEKLVALGPMLEQLNQDVFDPLIDISFNKMLARGMIPPPPPELDGQVLKPEYISVMHQAQKAVSLGSMDRFMDRTISMAEVDPSILDKVDRDQYIDIFAESTGIDPSIVVPDEEVVGIRQARAKAQQAREQAEMLKQVAPAAKTLSETDPAKGMLPAAMENMGGMP